MIQHNVLIWKEKQALLQRLRAGEPYVFPEYVKQFEVFDFTFAGLVSLLAYPQEAIKFARERLIVGDAKSYYQAISLASSWCQKNNVIPDTKWVNDLNALYTILPATERFNPPKRFIEGQTYFAGRKVRILTDDDAHKRRQEFMINPTALLGIEKLASLIGSHAAQNYFTAVVHNLKFVELDNGVTYDRNSRDYHSDDTTTVRRTL